MVEVGKGIFIQLDCAFCLTPCDHKNSPMVAGKATHGLCEEHRRK